MDFYASVRSLFLQDRRQKILNSNKIIDKETILIFDEFITSKYWENDEYKALNEFCDNFNYKYEVIAVSLYSKQVAVKLISK